METTFSPQARLGRLALLARYLTTILILFLSLGVVSFLSKFSSLLPWLLVIVIFPTLIYLWVVSTHRLHDINLSGWFFLLVFIPMIGWLFHLYMMCKKGNLQANEYGEPPVTQPWERVCGWLLIVLTVGTVALGLLGAILTPKRSLERAEYHQTRATNTTSTTTIKEPLLSAKVN